MLDLHGIQGRHLDCGSPDACTGSVIEIQKNPHSEISSRPASSQPDLSSVKWRTPKDRELCRRVWDRAAVVHDPASGETHYLNLMSIVALEQLEESDLSLDELASKMSVYLDVERSSEFDNQVAALIERFDQLGLIEPCIEPGIKLGRERP